MARHKEKKPSGSGTELAEFLNSNSSEKEKNRKSTTKDEEENNTSPQEKFVFVGDRYLTDVVFGNKSGMFTIRVALFDVSHESKAIAAARSIELLLRPMEDEKQNQSDLRTRSTKNEKTTKKRAASI